MSALYSREAFRLLNGHVEDVLRDANDIAAREAMHLGAFYAGLAIEHSMLGAAHACANPLTARYQITHGVALAIVLPHVVRWNAETTDELYGALAGDGIDSGTKGSPPDAGNRLAARLVKVRDVCGFPHRLRDTGVDEGDLEQLAGMAAEQWTGSFNPRPFHAPEALEVYRCAY